MATPNGVSEDSLKIAAEVFEIIANERELPEDNIKWFLDHIYEEATANGRGLYDVQMAFRDRDDVKAPFESKVDGEVIPVFTLLFSRRDDLESETFYDVYQWGIVLADPSTWVKANDLAKEFGKGNRPREWWDPDYQPSGPEAPPEDDDKPAKPPAPKTPTPKPPPEMEPPTTDTELVVLDNGTVTTKSTRDQIVVLGAAGLAFLSYKLLTVK